MEATIRLVDHEPPRVYTCPILPFCGIRSIGWCVLMIPVRYYITPKIAWRAFTLPVVLRDRVEVTYYWRG